ncbi:putative gustatory receptor 58b [Drosophila subpulchrella]|uniref:putative gustatory receptor 58b n=1 Tax=Drosophila subpulchrella TaxID=1486046 RepID=UPI0018A19BB6|nr:putative gustatory receptor 58b [Drosophila subpulchrella]
MLHSKLGRVMNLVYYHSVFFALMGTTLRIRSYKKTIRLDKLSRTYLLYSLFTSAFMFLNIYYMVPQVLLDSYIKYNIVLQLNFVVMVFLRIMSVLCCYLTIWLKRRKIIKLYRNSLIYWKRFRNIMDAIVNKQELKDLQISLARTMMQEIMVLYAAFLFSALVQYQLLNVVNKRSLLAFSIRLIHFLHLLAVKMAFYGLLILLNHQFVVIHLALNTLHKKKVGKKWKAVRSIATMHLETLQLARSIFRIYNVIHTTVFINMFMATMNILYHAVQFSNKTIKSDGWGIICGNGLIFFNIWGTLMFMEMLDKVVTSCNNTGQMLRQFNDLPSENKTLQRELDIFTMQLKRNHLVIKICGLVELDKSFCLSFIASILSNVIILMQFDLRRQQQPNHPQYLTHLIRNQSDV